MKRVLVLVTVMLALVCPGTMAATYDIVLDFSSGSQGYYGANWDWSSTEGVPAAGSMRQLGNYTDNLLTKSPTDTITIVTPSIMTVSASFQSMSSLGHGGTVMNYRLTYSDASTDLRTMSIYGIGVMNEWRSVAEEFVTEKPVASIELVSFIGFAPGFGPTYMYIDAVHISATSVGGDPVPGPVYGITNRAAYDPIISTVSSDISFTVMGKVKFLSPGSFSVDDGSGQPVTVVAPGFSGIEDGGFAFASGKFSGEGSSLVLNAQASDVMPPH